VAVELLELPNMPHYEARATYARQQSGKSAWGNELAVGGSGEGVSPDQTQQIRENYVK